MSGSKKEYEEIDLYRGALELLQCAHCWEDEVRLVGNVKASLIREICRDYARLRLEKGIVFNKSDVDQNQIKK